MQNLVLSVQNQVRPEELGAASSVVAFFRTLGGAVGVSALGARAGQPGRRLHAGQPGRAGHARRGGERRQGSIPKLSSLPAPVRAVVEAAFGHGVGDVFLYAAPLALLALIVILFIKEVPLQTVAALHQTARGRA